MSSNWSYGLEMAKLDLDLCDLDLWHRPFAWTSLLSMVITPGNVMMVGWWKHSENGVRHRQTRTDKWMDWTIHRAVWSQIYSRSGFICYSNYLCRVLGLVLDLIMDVVLAQVARMRQVLPAEIIQHNVAWNNSHAKICMSIHRPTENRHWSNIFG